MNLNHAVVNRLSLFLYIYLSHPLQQRSQQPSPLLESRSSPQLLSFLSLRYRPIDSVGRGWIDVSEQLSVGGTVALYSARLWCL